MTVCQSKKPIGGKQIIIMIAALINFGLVVMTGIVFLALATTQYRVAPQIKDWAVTFCNVTDSQLQLTTGKNSVNYRALFEVLYTLNGDVHHGKAAIHDLGLIGLVGFEDKATAEATQTEYLALGYAPCRVPPEPMNFEDVGIRDYNLNNFVLLNVDQSSLDDLLHTYTWMLNWGIGLFVGGMLLSGSLTIYLIYDLGLFQRHTHERILP